MLIKLLSYVPSIIGIFLTGLVVLLNNTKSRLNRYFFGFTVSITLVLFCLLVADTTQSQNIAIGALRLSNAFGILSSYFFILFSLAYPSKKIGRRRILLLGIFPLLLFIISLTNLVIPGVKITESGAQPQNISVLYTLISFQSLIYYILSGVVLVRKYLKLASLEKRRLSFILYGLIIAIVANFSTNYLLTVLDIQTNTMLLGGASLFIFSAFVAYAIVRHKLFDVRTVVARALTYLGAIITIAAVYGFLAFRVTTLFTENLSQNTQYAIYTILAVILAFTFQPLRRFFERVTDRIFFRDKYDPQTVLNNVSHILAGEIEMAKLSTAIIKAITAQMRIGKADIIVLDDEEVFYQSRPISGPHQDLNTKQLKKIAKSIVVADDLTTGERKQVMTDYGISVSLTLRTHDQFVGYLLLGEKLSGDIYNDTDLRVLRIIADELAIAITNAKSYAEIQQFNETLQTKIAWATQKLRHANDDLKELDKAKDEFISMASHQLRTPLTTTKGYVSMVLDGDFGKITKEQQDPLAQALDSANRMAGLVSDLLNVSRMDAGKFFIDAHDLDLAKIVQSEFNGLVSMAQSKNVKLELTPLPKSLPLIKLDEDKTRQVIMNLVDNAIHYSSPAKGGGDVHVSLKKDGGEVVFMVVDNGIGVPEKMKDKLFTKFYRAANAQASRPDGTGLGLYLVKRVVEDQGGSLIFESTEGKGSTFGFRFPLKTKFKSGVTKARVPLSG